MIDHAPQGDPCAKCAAPASRHRTRRPKHAPAGDPCDRCGHAASSHTTSGIERVRKAHRYAGPGPCTHASHHGDVCGLPRENHRTDADCDKMRAYNKKRPGRQSDRVIVGIDGEGIDAPDGSHLYTYLAAVDERGRVLSEGRNSAGLSHEECIAVLARIPQNTLKFGFMFSYDLTKILEQMPAGDRYYLFRPDSRRVLRCTEKGCGRGYKRTLDGACAHCGSYKEPREVTRPVEWNGRGYDFLAGSFTVFGKHDKTRSRGRGQRRRRRSLKVWDCFRFFGCSFVAALENWDVGTKEERAEILEMKNKRGAFDKESPADVERYCQRECHLLAMMMRKLIDAHVEAGIPLKRFDGVGSSATALLKKYHVQKYRGPKPSELDPELARVLRASFFGGRFEDAWIGVLPGPIYGYDISSAYPYAMVPLPCLKCGEWRHVRGSKRQIERLLRESSAASAGFRVRAVSPKERRELAWCPLPCRMPDGSIAYGTNFTGWAWAEELLPALRSMPELVELTGEAWVYETPCTHRPFKFMPKAYRKRIEWGKEGRGLTMKGACNACYGKLAQTVGGDRAPFHSFALAGMTTGTTRGQLTTAISRADDPWDVAAVATDGIYSLSRLRLPRPDDTGTSDLPKPLGGWEEKVIPEGCFIAKPGLYWRLDAKIGEVRARGIGRRDVLREKDALIAGFLAWDRRSFDYGVPVVSRRFHGAKSSTIAMSGCGPCETRWVGTPEKRCPDCGRVGTWFRPGSKLDDDGREWYGRWQGDFTPLVKFDPYPKRERNIDRRGKCARLRVRDLGGITSAPYEGKTTPQGEEAREETELALEQPDWEEGAA